ncbi:MAG: hypothetical protein ACE1ZK_06590, partial [Nitrospirales bacterium]
LFSLKFRDYPQLGFLLFSIHDMSQAPKYHGGHRDFLSNHFLVTFLNLLLLNKNIEFFLFFHFGTWLALLNK